MKMKNKFISDKLKGGAIGYELDSLHDKSSIRKKYNANQVQELET